MTPSTARRDWTPSPTGSSSPAPGRARSRCWNAYGVTVLTSPAGGMVAHADVVYVIDADGNLATDPRCRPGVGHGDDASSFSGLLASQITRCSSVTWWGSRRPRVWWRGPGRRWRSSSWRSPRRPRPTRGPRGVDGGPRPATAGGGHHLPGCRTVVLAMGQLDDPANTFYELFDRPTGRTAWTLATPPGSPTTVGWSWAPPPRHADGRVPAVGGPDFSVLAQTPGGADELVAGRPPRYPGRRARRRGHRADGQVAAVLVRSGGRWSPPARRWRTV